MSVQSFIPLIPHVPGHVPELFDELGHPTFADFQDQICFQ